jgi:hypothetical protein
LGVTVIAGLLIVVNIWLVYFWIANVDRALTWHLSLGTLLHGTVTTIALSTAAAVGLWRRRPWGHACALFLMALVIGRYLAGAATPELLVRAMNGDLSKVGLLRAKAIFRIVMFAGVTAYLLRPTICAHFGLDAPARRARAWAVVAGAALVAGYQLLLVAVSED